MKIIQFSRDEYEIIQRLLTTVLKDPKIMDMNHEQFGSLSSAAEQFTGPFDEPFRDGTPAPIPWKK